LSKGEDKRILTAQKIDFNCILFFISFLPCVFKGLLRNGREWFGDVELAGM
jgi:hypothetical protein